MCRACHTFDDVELIPTNFSLIEIIDQYQTSEDHQIGSCEVCDEKHEATFQCLDCLELLCIDASQFHTKTKLTRGHKVVSITEARAFFVANKGPTVILCPTHSKEYEYYDETCQAMLCVSCVILDGHTGHKCVAIKDASMKKKEELSEVKNRLVNRKKQLIDGENNLRDILTELEEKYEVIGCKIDIEIRELIKLLEIRRNELLKDLKNLYKSKDKVLFDQLELLVIFRESMESAERLCDSTLAYSDSAKFLSAFGDIIASLKNLHQQQLQLSPQDNSNLQFKLLHSALSTNTLNNDLSNIGVIFDGSPSALHCKAEGDGLVCVLPNTNSSFTITPRRHDGEICQRNDITLSSFDFMLTDMNNVPCPKTSYSIGVVLSSSSSSSSSNIEVIYSTSHVPCFVHINIKGMPIQGSPFRVDVLVTQQTIDLSFPLAAHVTYNWDNYRGYKVNAIQRGALIVKGMLVPENSSGNYGVVVRNGSEVSKTSAFEISKDYPGWRQSMFAEPITVRVNDGLMIAPLTGSSFVYSNNANTPRAVVHHVTPPTSATITAALQFDISSCYALSLGGNTYNMVMRLIV